MLVQKNKNNRVCLCLAKLETSMKNYISENHKISDDMGICKCVKLKLNIKLRIKGDVEKGFFFTVPPIGGTKYQE